MKYCRLFFILLLFVPLVAFAIGDAPAPSDGEAALISEIGRSPNDPALRDELGEIYLRGAMLDKAIREFQTAVSLDPSDLRGRYDLGLVYEISGEYAEAAQAYRDAVSWSACQLNFRLGLCYNKLGMFAEAAESLRKAEAIKDSAGIRYALADSEAGLRDFNGAAEDLETAMEMDSGFLAGKDYFPDQAAAHETLDGWRRQGESGRRVMVLSGLGAAFLSFLILLEFILKKREQGSPEEY